MENELSKSQMVGRMEYVLGLAKMTKDGCKEDELFGTLAGMMETFEERYGYRPILVGDAMIERLQWFQGLTPTRYGVAIAEYDENVFFVITHLGQVEIHTLAYCRKWYKALRGPDGKQIRCSGKDADSHNAALVRHLQYIARHGLTDLAGAAV